MFDYIENAEIIIEVRELVKTVDSVRDGISDYCEFMKQTFLAGSGRN